MERLITKLEKLLISISNDLKKNRNNHEISEDISLLLSKLDYLEQKHENAQSIDTYKTVVMQVINNQYEQVTEFLSEQNKKMIPIIKNLFQFILAAAEAARVYILPKGCIEHYYTQSKILYMPVSGKDKLFRIELDFLQDAHRKTVMKNYSELISLLEKATSL